MSKNPDFNYSEFALMGFKKTFPVLLEADPGSVANWLYYTVSGFSGRGGYSLAGGGYDDTVCLCAAATGVELEVCSAREIKNGLRARLHRAWQSNDHAVLMSIARGFERNASMSVVDYQSIDWINSYRVVEEEDVGLEIPEAVEEWIEVFFEPSIVVSTVGNYSRSRCPKKPNKLSVKSLFDKFEGV